MQNVFKEIRSSRSLLTPQQYHTLMGQARAGDTDGARKGLYTIIHRLGSGGMRSISGVMDVQLVQPRLCRDGITE